MLNLAVIDDDKMSRKIFGNYIDQTNFLHCQYYFESAVKAISDTKFKNVDLIILDVEMPELSGLEFLEKLEVVPQVILTSVNTDYAVQAFDFDVIDFLAKPVSYSRFLKSIYRAQSRKEHSENNLQNSDHIYIKLNNGHTRIDFEDITYIEAYSDYMNIHTINSRLTALCTMKAIEERLPKDKFMRVHRSYIVHLDKINRLEDNMILMGDKIVPVSRSCKEKLLNRLNIFR